MAIDKAAFMASEGVEPKPDAVTVSPDGDDDTHVMVSVDEPREKPAQEKPDAKPDAKAAPVRAADDEALEDSEPLDPLSDTKRGPGRPQKGYVKQEALWEARGREKAERERRIELERLLAERQAPQQQPEQQQPAQPPNPEDDIFAYLEWQKGEIARLNAQQAQVQQFTEGQRVQNQVMAYYQNDFQQVAKEKPDLMNAYEHLAQSRRREYGRMGITDPQQQTQMLVDEEMQIVRYALQNNLRPSEVIYGFAEERGYRPPDATGGSSPAAGASQNGAALDRIAKSQQANMSLGSVPGGAVKQMTAKDINALPEEQQWEMRRRNPKAYEEAIRRLA